MVTAHYPLPRTILCILTAGSGSVEECDFGHDSIAEFGDDGSNAVSDIADADYQSEVDARAEQVVIERCTRGSVVFLAVHGFPTRFHHRHGFAWLGFSTDALQTFNEKLRILHHGVSPKGCAVARWNAIVPKSFP